MNAPLNVPHALCACEKRGGKLKDKCSQRGQELCLCCAVLKDLGGPDRLFTLLPASKLTTGSVCQVAVVSKFNLSWHPLLSSLSCRPLPFPLCLSARLAYGLYIRRAAGHQAPSPIPLHSAYPLAIHYIIHVHTRTSRRRRRCCCHTATWAAIWRSRWRRWWLCR